MRVEDPKVGWVAPFQKGRVYQSGLLSLNISPESLELLILGAVRRHIFDVKVALRDGTAPCSTS